MLNKSNLHKPKHFKHYRNIRDKKTQFILSIE